MWQQEVKALRALIKPDFLLGNSLCEALNKKSIADEEARFLDYLKRTDNIKGIEYENFSGQSVIASSPIEKWIEISNISRFFFNYKTHERGGTESYVCRNGKVFGVSYINSQMIMHRR